MKLDFLCRVHTVNLIDPTEGVKEKKKSDPPPRLPPSVVLIDTEAIENLAMDFEFGCYAYCELVDGIYIPREEGIFFADGLSLPLQQVIRQYAGDHPPSIVGPGQPKLIVRSRQNFVDHMLWTTLRAGGAAVGLNLGFDLSRIVAPHIKGWSNHKDGAGFGFYFSEYFNPKTRKWEYHRFRPPITRIAIDSKKSFYGVGFSLATEEENWEFRQSRFIDVRTVAAALTNQGHSLKSLCRVFNAPPEVAKSSYVPGPVSPDKIRYCLQDVRATLWALNTLAAEFLRHPTKLPIDKAYSPVSLAKSYLDKMNISPPNEKFHIPPEIQGAAMEAFYAGRAETKIRKRDMPAVYLDFISQYPSVFHLLRSQEILIAESLTFDDCTAEAQALLDGLTLDDLFKPDLWPHLRFFAQITPDNDVLPVRAPFNGNSPNIAFNHFNYGHPVFYAGPGLAAAKIVGNGKVPSVVRAFRVVPHGIQGKLKPVWLRGEAEVNPLKYDMARKVVETRYSVKRSNRPLANFLKVMGNGGMFYGLFAEVSPEREDKDIKVQVFTGNDTFFSTTRDIENTGRWYCPVLASLIVSGGHLLLAVAERLIQDSGGHHILTDTDSIVVVSSEHGGLIPCPGGQHRLPDGREAVLGLTWEETLKQVIEPLDRLHPYDRDKVVDHFLKVDEVNLGPDGTQRELFAFSISSKRYCLYTYTRDGKRVIVKVSAHGLGYLMPPIDDTPEARESEGRDEHKWIYEAWEWILARELDGEEAARRCWKEWFDFPAMMQLTVTTPHVIQQLRHMPWARPMNFMNVPIIAHGVVASTGEDISLVGPYNPDPESWGDAVYINRHDGKPYQIGAGPERVPCRTYGSILQSYRLHPESKFLGPDGLPCGPETQGLLQRMTVEGAVKHPLRKESNRRWAEGNDLSLIERDEDDTTGGVFVREAKPNYHRTKQSLSAEVRDWLKTLPLKQIARTLNIDRNSLRKGCGGKPVAASTQKKILLLFRLTKRGLNLSEALDAIRIQTLLQITETT